MVWLVVVGNCSCLRPENCRWGLFNDESRNLIRNSGNCFGVRNFFRNTAQCEADCMGATLFKIYSEQ